MNETYHATHRVLRCIVRYASPSCALQRHCRKTEEMEEKRSKSASNNHARLVVSSVDPVHMVARFPAAAAQRAESVRKICSVSDAATARARVHCRVSCSCIITAQLQQQQQQQQHIHKPAFTRRMVMVFREGRHTIPPRQRPTREEEGSRVRGAEDTMLRCTFINTSRSRRR